MFLGPCRHQSCFVSCVTLKRCWIPFSIQQAKKSNFLALGRDLEFTRCSSPAISKRRRRRSAKKHLLCERERNDYATFYDWKGGKKFFAIHAINFTPSWFFIWKYGCSGVVLEKQKFLHMDANYNVEHWRCDDSLFLGMSVDKSYGRYCAPYILMSRLEINKCHGRYWHICHCLQHLVMNEQCECQFCN